MALVTERRASVGPNEEAFLDLIYDDVTNLIVAIAWGNALAVARRFVVRRLSDGSIIANQVVAAGTARTQLSLSALGLAVSASLAAFKSVPVGIGIGEP